MKQIILAILVCFMSFTSVVAQSGKEVYIPKIKIKDSKLKNKKVCLKVDNEKYLITKDTIISGIKVRRKASLVKVEMNNTKQDVSLVVDDKEMVLSGIDSTNKNIYYKNGKRVDVENLSEIDANDILSVTINDEETKNVIIVTDKKQKSNKGNIIISNRSGKDPQTPLIVINGVPQNENYSMKELSPDTIKEIKVLKGKSAKISYGTRGKNGVIIITTKKNK